MENKYKESTPYSNGHPIYLLTFLIAALIFYLHAQFIINHFSGGGYLLDSGWFAYLFESDHFILKNPKSINELSFYSHHLSPYLFFLAFPLHHFFNLSGIDIFALHQGFFYTLFFLSITLMVLTLKPPPILAFLSSIVLGALTNILFQAACYPHYEISILAISTAALTSYVLKYKKLFYLLILSVIFVREDGGFYSAFICLLLAITSINPKDDRTLYHTAAIMVACSLLAVVFKTCYFPGFDAFQKNFSGNHWDHITWLFLIERVENLLVSSYFIFILGSMFLSFFDRRYIVALILLLPLFVLHLLSIRDTLGVFSLYYGLPWLFIGVSWILIYRQRIVTKKNKPYEGFMILFLLLVVSLMKNGNQLSVLQFLHDIKLGTLSASKQRIVLMKTEAIKAVEFARNEQKSICVSKGIAALIPSYLKADEVLGDDSNLKPCQLLFLFKGDMDYSVLSERSESEGYRNISEIDRVEIKSRIIASG